jgi:hypothetical protein
MDRYNDLQSLRHGHGPHHNADAQQLPADHAEMKRASDPVDDAKFHRVGPAAFIK